MPVSVTRWLNPHQPGKNAGAGQESASPSRIPMTELLAYVGLGSNLDNPESQVKTAIEALAGLPQTLLQACSSLYRSAPMGPQVQ
ncbi:MAG: 2-amino-4-hydroxy-6-hydroxymethyldihydropteridine diphosphokinase, partial [Thiogranum sp.]